MKIKILFEKVADKKINLCEEEKMAPVSGQSGYWGLPTTTMDWCEQNYEVSVLVVTECQTYLHLVC